MAFWVPPTSPAKVPVNWKAELAWKAGTRSTFGLRTEPPTAIWSLSRVWARTDAAMAGMPAPPSSTPYRPPVTVTATTPEFRSTALPELRISNWKLRDPVTGVPPSCNWPW